MRLSVGIPRHLEDVFVVRPFDAEIEKKDAFWLR